MANKKVSQLVSKPSVLVTDLFPIADPTTGQLFKTTISDLGTAIGSGVSSVNTLVGAVVLDTDDIQELASPTNRWFTDTRARAALSASSPLAYNSGTGVFSIAQANGSTNGFLSSTDWTTFNSKQAALSGTGFVKISGTTISYDNSTYLTTSAAASTYLALAGGTLTGALNGTSATFTGDLTLSATNPRLYLTDTDNNPDYFISNTDGTFTIYDVTNSTSRLTISTLNTILNTNLRVDGDVLIKQDSVLGGVSGYTAIASDTDGIFLKLGTASAHAYLVLSGLTNYRNFSFPDATGTLALTSDLSAYLPLTGGVLSGSLRSTGYYLTGMTAGSGALYYSSGSNRVTVANYNASGIVTFEVNGGNTALTLNSNLSATFANTITVSGNVISNGGVIAPLNGGSIEVYNTGNSNYFDLKSVSGNFALRTNVGAGAVNALTIASTGAATFSSSVTATQVAIGTTNATAGLEVVTNGSTTNAIRIATNVAFNASPEVAIVSRYKYNSAGDYTIGSIINTAKDNTTDGSQSGNLQFFTNNGTTFVERMRITSSGVIAFNGSSSPNSGSIDKLSIGFENGVDGWIQTWGGRPLSLNSQGNPVLIGTRTSLDSGYLLQTKTSGGGTAITTQSSQDSYIPMRFLQANGGLAGFISAGTGSVSYNTSSDYRLKEDLKQINGLEIVNKIKVYDYKWKASGTRMDGVLAHELAEVLPYAVHGIKDGEMMQGVDYSKIVPVMVQAIKELKAKIETLENK